MDPTSQEDQVIVNLPHHIQQELCTTRAPYRQGKKLKAVKVVGNQVYTVSNESQHLLIHRVPEINLHDELHALCKHYGQLLTFHKLELLDPGEEFTEIFHVCYAKIRDARKAKRFLDGRSFYGGLLHVCYAPELESVDETRLKLINRRNEIAYFTGRSMKVPNISSKIISKRKASVSRGDQGKKIARSTAQRTEHSKYGERSENVSSIDDSLDEKLITSYRLPQVIQPENDSLPGTSSETLIVGPYDQLPKYPSQEILKLPGHEIKLERDRKFMPTPLTKMSTNKIIFHQKNGN